MLFLLATFCLFCASLTPFSADFAWSFKSLIVLSWLAISFWALTKPSCATLTSLLASSNLSAKSLAVFSWLDKSWSSACLAFSKLDNLLWLSARFLLVSSWFLFKSLMRSWIEVSFCKFSKSAWSLAACFWASASASWAFSKSLLALLCVLCLSAKSLFAESLLALAVSRAVCASFNFFWVSSTALWLAFFLLVASASLSCAFFWLVWASVKVFWGSVLLNES